MKYSTLYQTPETTTNMLQQLRNQTNISLHKSNCSFGQAKQNEGELLDSCCTSSQKSSNSATQRDKEHTVFTFTSSSLRRRALRENPKLEALLKLGRALERVSLGVRSCELFLCFVAIVRVRAILLTSLFSLFYVTGDWFHRFLHRGRAVRT